MVFFWIIRNDIDAPHIFRIQRCGLGICLLQVLHPFHHLFQNEVPVAECHGPRGAGLHTCGDFVVGDSVNAHGALEKHLALRVLPRNIIRTGGLHLIEWSFLGVILEDYGAGLLILRPIFRTLR